MNGCYLGKYNFLLVGDIVGINLKSMLYKFMNEYKEAYDQVKESQNYKHPLSSFIRNDIVKEIRTNIGLDSSKYKVKGSNGAGRWTTVPWIAVFDLRITDSAQRGVYIVYLLNKDKKELYLTLNQGATEATENKGNLTFTGVANSSDTKAFTKLRNNAIAIQNILGNIQFAKDDLIQSGSVNYDAGAICYKKYTLDNLPEDKELYDDLKEFVAIYDRYANWYLNNAAENDWWPSKEEYDPGISKEKWLELLSRNDVFGEYILKMLAAMDAEGGAISCAELAEKYGNTSSHYVMTAVHAAENIIRVTNCPVINDEGDKKFWPVLFIGRDGTDSKRFIWKIRTELHEALKEYGVEKFILQNDNEYRIGTFDSWEIIDEYTAIKHCDKSFFDYRDSGVPKGICWFFDAENMTPGETKTVKLLYRGKPYQGSVKNISTDRRRVQISWNAELGKLFDVYNSSDATATFKKVGDGVYEVIMKGGEAEMTVKEKVTAIKEYIAAKGFNYEGDLIENFYLSLKSKSFVILAGTSGTGKTRLVKLFAEAIGATAENGRYKLVSVRPDWSDSSDLFGYTDLSGNFHSGAIIDFIKKAEWDKASPYFLCLDEMNLARVEYYFSDFLSIMETRERKENGDIETDALVDPSYFKSQTAREKYGRVYIPENLYIVGTVNMDETTFPFSKKVLDRANTIEFSFVNLMAKPSAVGQALPQKLDNSFLKTEYLLLRDCEDEDFIEMVCFNLEELNQILLKANLHVGYRVRDEIAFYMMNNKNANLLNENVAFDYEIMQKILPRIQGSSAAIKEVLSALFIKCAGDYIGLTGNTAFEQMETYMASKGCKYPNSAKKIAFMMRRYEEDGFTSYWL